MALRQIATRCAVATAIVGTGTNRYFVRTIHDVFDTAPLRLKTANIYISGGVEVAGPGVITQRAALEYPVDSGAFYDVSWSSSTTSTMGSGAIVLSDPCVVPLVLSSGATRVALLRDMQSTNGVPYGSGQNVHSPADGDAVEINPANTTLKRALVNQQASWNMFPAGMLSDTLVESAVIFGDSKAADPNTTDGHLYRGEIATLLGALGVPYINCAVNGDTAAAFIANNAALRSVLAGDCTFRICQYGRNDFAVLGHSVTQVETDVAAIQALDPSKPFWVVTHTPETDSTDSYATLVNQTQRTPTSANQITLNNRRRAGILSGATGYVELSDIGSSSRDSGKWVVDGTAFAFVSDGTHETSRGMARYSAAVAFPSFPSRSFTLRQYQMQARSSSDNKLRTWINPIPDRTGAVYLAKGYPGTPLDIVICSKPQTKS